MFGASIGSVVYSMFLLGVSLIAVGKLCPLCMGLYVINIGLFLTAWLSHPQGRRGAFGALPALWRRFETWLAVVLVAGAVFGFQNLYAQQARATRQASRALLPNAGPPIALDLDEATAHGPSDAALTVVEFSDFQCPYCRKLADALKAAADQHGNVRIVFRHYPMDASCNRAVEGKFHEFACGAAKAALCAEAQGRFWAMHDVMFENQRALSPAELTEHARTAGLDTAAFARCLEAPETAARLERDLARAESLKLKGTPSWFVNGLAYVGARSVDELLAIFERTAPGKARGAGGSDAKATDHHP
jgi:protein-disulfide isomerase